MVLVPYLFPGENISTDDDDIFYECPLPLFPKTLKGQCQEKSFQTETVGFRLGPSDVPHPLLTSVHSPFNLLRSFKDNVHRSKTDFTIV